MCLQEASRVEAEQEQQLKAKYGGMKPKQRLIPKVHLCPAGIQF